VPPWKFFYLERNRFFMLANIYRWRTLALLLPALLLTEAGVWWFALRGGWGMTRAKAASYIAIVRGLRSMLRNRARVQAMRRVADRDLLAIVSTRLPAGLRHGAGPLTRLANAFFDGYAALLRRAIRW
jgi:hypothetical protein